MYLNLLLEVPWPPVARGGGENNSSLLALPSCPTPDPTATCNKYTSLCIS